MWSCSCGGGAGDAVLDDLGKHFGLGDQLVTHESLSGHVDEAAADGAGEFQSWNRTVSPGMTFCLKRTLSIFMK